MPYVKSPAVHNICCESNTDDNRKIVVELHVGTDHDVE